VVIRPLDASPPSTVTAGGGGAVAPDVHVPDAADAAAAPAPSREAVAKAVEQVNAHLDAQNRAIEFTIDPDTKAVVVKLIDKQDNQVLRQVPSQEMLEIAKALDQLQGKLLRNQA
jgi:flagellar protein FlaG